MKLLINSICIIFIFLPGISISQDQGVELDRWSDPEVVKPYFHNNIAKDEDKLHLYDDWRTGDIFFKSGIIIRAYPIRYDLRYNLLEIEVNDEIFVQTISRIEHFTLTDKKLGEIEEFCSGENYRDEEGGSIEGICQIHSMGTYSYFTNVYFVMMEPDYIKAFDTGNKEMKPFIKKRLLLCNKNIAYPKPPGKMSTFKIFGTDSKEASRFADQNDLNPRKHEDLKAIVDHLNTSHQAENH